MVAPSLNRHEEALNKGVIDSGHERLMGFVQGIWRWAGVGAAALVLLAGGIDASGAAMTRQQAQARAAMLRQAGAAIFNDPGLSGSGRLACASCHVPGNAFGPVSGRAVEAGGPDLSLSGHRAVPSLTYTQVVPAFNEHMFDIDPYGDDSVDAGPSGGLTWDGRVDRAGDQARIPLYSPVEMAASGPAMVAKALRAAPYAGLLRQLAGEAAFSQDEALVGTALSALEAYQQTPELFYPYSSKYDAYLQGKTSLTPQEARGLALFNDEDKGNCASCHKSAVDMDGTPPQFTDYGLIALGVPRNLAIPANADAAFFDLGLCGPDRTDFKDRSDYCGLFRTPSLRNVALRKHFFHNGVFSDLTQAVAFYATRDTDPARWFPRKADGTLDAFDDLPAPYRANLNMDPPFGGKVGDKPALSEAEIADIVAFLGTLTDGWKAAE